MSNKAKRMSFNLCDETCPALEQMVYGAYDDICKKLDLNDNQREIVFNILIEEYCEKFKDVGTHLLRDALNKCCENVLDLEDRIDELEYEIKNS